LLPESLLAGPVALRRFVASDADRVELLAGEYEVAETTALIPHPYPRGGATAWIATHDPAAAAGVEYTYAITDHSGLVVGAIGLRPLRRERETVGYWVGRRYWGHGYATAAALAIIVLAFELLDLEAVTASHLVRNVASARVMEKCGMRLLRHERRDHRGALEDFCVRGITRDEWERSMAE
jgi:[ribosomal protein S5]-alanine N-acetyltransferase